MTTFANIYGTSVGLTWKTGRKQKQMLRLGWNEGHEKKRQKKKNKRGKKSNKDVRKE